MKLTSVVVLTLLQQSSAFAPTPFTRPTNTRSNTFKQSAVIDPSILADAHQHVDAFSNLFSSIVLSDESVVAAVATPEAAETAAAAAQSSNGWFGFLEGPIEFLLQGIHTSLMGIGLGENTWGVAIIIMTTLIKLATYPLTAQQLGSTSKMQVSL